MEAAWTAWGIAGLAFVAAAVAAIAVLKGRLRVAAGGASLVAAALLLTLAVATTGSDVGRGEKSAPRVDSGRAAALALLADAEEALNRGDDSAAAGLLARALALYREREDLAGQASVYLGLGRMEHYTGRSDAARANFSEALALSRRAGNAPGEPAVLAAWGDLEKDTFQWESAMRLYREARAAWPSGREPKHDSHVVLRMAAAPGAPQGEAEARAVLGQAEAIFAAVGDTEARGDVSSLTALLNWNLGLLALAREAYSRAQLLYEEAGAHGKVAESVLGVARASIWTGRNLAARDALIEAASLFSRTDDLVGLARTRMLRGDLLRLQGRMEAAGDEYAAAAEAFAALSHGEAAAAFLRLGRVEAYLSRTDAAHAALQRAAELSSGDNNELVHAGANLALAAAPALGQAAARTLLAAARTLYEAAGDAAGQGQVSLAQAFLAAAQGEEEDARAAYAAGAAKFRQAGSAFGRVLAAAGLGRLENEVGFRPAAAAAYREAAGLLQAMGDPVAEANRFMNLPPVGSLFLTPPEEVPDHIEALRVAAEGAEAAEAEDEIIEVQRAAAEAHALASAANLAQFPDHNIEARALVANLEARLASAFAGLPRPGAGGP